MCSKAPPGTKPRKIREQQDGGSFHRFGLGRFRAMLDCSWKKKSWKGELICCGWLLFCCFFSCLSFCCCNRGLQWCHESGHANDGQGRDTTSHGLFPSLLVLPGYCQQIRPKTPSNPTTTNNLANDSHITTNTNTSRQHTNPKQRSLREKPCPPHQPPRKCHTQLQGQCSSAPFNWCRRQRCEGLMVCLLEDNIVFLVSFDWPHLLTDVEGIVHKLQKAQVTDLATNTELPENMIVCNTQRNRRSGARSEP